MTEIVAQARQAREKLAAALALLQNPEAGNLIDTVAGPVAKAMGALHQVESSAGAKLAESGPAALDAVRAALAALQAQPDTPASEQAMEYVAGSLGMVHGLAEQAKSAATPKAEPAATPKAEPAATPKTETVGERARPAAQSGALDSTQLAPQHVSAAPKQPAPAAPSGGLDATLPTPTPSHVMGSSNALGSTQTSAHSRGGIASPTQESATNPNLTAPKKAETSQHSRNSKMAPPPEGGKPAGSVEVEANLGAHSPTNFYKGLSGNDVIDDGGLFVATYEIPAIGTTLWISVNMPGGYQFEAVAEVRWTRESSAGDAPPGYGCAFKNLTDEARKLVYRYVRNREPLFHDDL